MEKFKKIWSMCFLALVLLMPSVASAQNLTVRGKVVDSSGEAILGAYVYQSGTQNGTVSDLDGNFQLSTPPVRKSPSHSSVTPRRKSPLPALIF